MTVLQTGLLHIGMFLYALSFLIACLYISSGSNKHIRVVQILSVIAAILHSVMLLNIGVTNHYFPATNMFESFVFMSVILVFFALAIDKIRSMPIITIITTLLVFSSLVVVIALLTPSDSGREVVKEEVKDFLTWFHVAVTLLSYVAFELAFITGIIYLLEQRQLKAKSRQFLLGLFPSLEAVYRINVKSSIYGFLLLTLGIVIGYMKARDLYTTNEWRMSPRVILTTLTWAAYLIVVIFIAIPKFRGKKVTVASVCSFVFVILTFWATIFWKDFHYFK